MSPTRLASNTAGTRGTMIPLGPLVKVSSVISKVAGVLATGVEENSSVASPSPRAFSDRISKKYEVPFESGVPLASFSTAYRSSRPPPTLPVYSGILVQVDGNTPPAGLTRYS